MAATYSFADSSFRNLVEKLIDSDPMNLGHIDPDSIIYLNKEEKSPKVVMRISMIKEPFVMLLNKMYLLEISEEMVKRIPSEHTELHMYRVLKQIDMNDGRIRYPDVVEFKDIIDMFGYDWANKEHIPSILKILNGENNAIKKVV